MSAGFPWNQGNTGGRRPPLQSGAALEVSFETETR